jgi:hypothetical protein
MDWTVKLSDVSPEAMARYGAKEIYIAYFVPKGYGGQGPAVSLGIPECELIMAVQCKDGEPMAVVNRPMVNRNIKTWIRTTCETALDIDQAVVSFNCDTPEQLEYAIKLAVRWLPGYERAPLERMAMPEGRAKGGLS